MGMLRDVCELGRCGESGKLLPLKMESARLFSSRVGVSPLFFGLGLWPLVVRNCGGLYG